MDVQDIQDELLFERILLILVKLFSCMLTKALVGIIALLTGQIVGILIWGF